jgi:hypothetical protein
MYGLGGVQPYIIHGKKRNTGQGLYIENGLYGLYCPLVRTYAIVVLAVQAADPQVYELIGG